MLTAAGVLIVTLVVVLVAGGGAAQPRPALLPAKGFNLGELGHPGQHVSLAAFAGRPVIISFFASWCAPCKRETPLLAQFYREHHGRIQVIGIDSNDEPSAGLRFTRAAGVTYPVGIDPFPSPVASSYGISVLPQTFMLNARHRIVRHIFGAVTSSQLNAWANSLASRGKG